MRLPVLLLAFLCQIMSFLGNTQTLTNIQVLQENDFDMVGLRTFTPSVEFESSVRSSITGSNEVEELAKWQTASSSLKRKPETILKLVKLQNQNPRIRIADVGSTDETIIAATYTIIAFQNDEFINKYLETNITSDVIKGSVLLEIEEVKRLVRKATASAVVVSATGNIRGVASDQESANPDAKGTGTFSVVYARESSIWAAQLSVASTLDTLKSDLGSFILTPTEGSFLKSGSLEWYAQIKGKSWFHIYANMASQTWEIARDSIYKDATILGLGVLYRYRLIEGMVAKNEIGLDLEIGLSHRWIGGNVRNLLDNGHGTVQYKNALSTTKNGFGGIEAGFAVNFGQVVGGLQLYHYFGKGIDRVDYLTGLQLAVGLSVRGDLLKALLDSRD